MRSGDQRDPWDLSRLGDEDFVSEPLDPRARAHGDVEDEHLGGSHPTASGRRLRPEEREALRRQARQKRQLPPEYFGQTPVPAKRRWPRWGGVAVILLAIIIAGNISLLRSRGGGDDATPDVVASATATLAEVAVAVSPTIPANTPTPEPTATAQPSPTPTPEPTPDPRFAGLVVCLDPGHGGSDRGYTRDENAMAPAMEEAPINLEVALAVAEGLEGLGFEVVLTRSRDDDVNADGTDINGDGKTRDNQTGADAISAEAMDELQARINVCNDANADVLLSIHINGHPDLNASGFETWYSASRPFVGQNKLIAALIASELGKGYAAAGYTVTDRGVRDDSTVDVDGHQDLFDSYVMTGPTQPGKIVGSSMPGTIAEALFISNDRDAQILASEQGRQVIVDAYIRAIVAYFDTILGPNPDAE
jgi:N-acetylmuramoyl-L-alanine amidase